MIRSNIEVDLLRKLQELPMFSCPENELENYGMKQAVDYPRSKNHIYHEGYYHTFMDQKAIYSRNPRSGADFMKSAAGLFISSFYEATRQLNYKLWLDASNRSPSDPSSDICGTLSEWISGGFHFGDLSIQVHYGTAIGGDELFWHSDAENSLLHLGLSIRGDRVLHSKRAEKPDEMVKELLEPQSAGDVYLSTSTLINHAPSYPEVEWEHRIIALQARILYSSTQLRSFRERNTPESWRSLTTILTSELSTLDLKVPTLQQVQAVMAGAAV
eukprot:CAMPEP_0170126140 /NCGR_PEP_ID=MMETSP0020_2-20130122/19483_1 /TAXON_ID=98059 /ORGANISM="Dinobryon sp., Strain UTEXLB2267" /LENGTH=271 /DNA_ID=CAMNT_0010358983 /DNA_START=284 /DNA_END=1099 /DNA_ORIENTATION=-